MKMEPLEQWIWLPKAQYPNHQETYYTPMHPQGEGHYTVVSVTRRYTLNKAVKEAVLRFSADAAFVLSLNGKQIACGPAAVGGDFLFNETMRPQYYASELTVSMDADGQEAMQKGILAFDALVRMMPVQIFEFSKGHGGFFLTAHVTFADGTKTVLRSDESWQMQRHGAFIAPRNYDGRIPDDEPVFAEAIDNRWHCLTSQIPVSTREMKIPKGGGRVVIAAGETIDVTLPLDRIYAGHLYIRTETETETDVHVRCSETGEWGTDEHCIFAKPVEYCGFTLHSAGMLVIHAGNTGTQDAVLHFGFAAECYPAPCCAKTVTSDADLNLVLDVCAHTLKYCRQTIHLDSPRHTEPLACTGDYYIESCMTAFSYGDQRLSAFDIRRTAQNLRYHDGRMFHTTYSLIWVQMLWDVYMLTGDKTLLSDCEDALIILMERFASYFGDNGIIETPPDFMFVDWLYPDGISTHHPPKALGQTCMNLFYYGAQKTAAKIYTELGEPAMAEASLAAAEQLRAAISEHLYDRERGLFFEGLNTPTPEHLIREEMPQNADKRYYRMHANILAAYFGIFEPEECRALLQRTLADQSLGLVQPYFKHFLLDAVYRNGMRTEWTLPILEEWKAPCRECPAGLPEGFYKPEPAYYFDHSHAWGGTPAYALPLALSGLTILEPGYRKIRLEPNLLGLSYAAVEIPTPFGVISLSMKDDGTRTVRIPDGIEAEVL